MVWSYSGDPNETPKDAVRFRISDTDTNDQLVQDEEIDYMLDQNGGDIKLAAAELAETISRIFARQADFETPDLSVSFKERAKTYAELSRSLSDSTNFVALAYGGGISVADKETREADTDRVTPTFKTGQFPYEREGGDPP